MSTMDHTTATKLITLNFLNESVDVIDNKYPLDVLDIVRDIMKNFVNGKDETVRYKACDTIFTQFQETKYLKLLADVKMYRPVPKSNKKNKENFGNMKFVHKCVIEKVEKPDSQLDFVDMEAIFGNEEPDSKRIKLNNNKIVGILNRIDADVDLLYKLKENIFGEQQRNKINVICDKLKDIIS